MRLGKGDLLLGMHVVDGGADTDVLVATEGGFAKRTPADQYPVQGRGGLGVVTARIVEARGELIGALMVGLEDEVFAITSAGGVIRTTAAEIKQSGRHTMGVRLVNLAAGQTLVAIARNAEVGVQDENGLDDEPGEGDEVDAVEAGLDEIESDDDAGSDDDTVSDDDAGSDDSDG